MNISIRKDDELQADGRSEAPSMVQGLGHIGNELIAASSPLAPQVEALRSLRAQLMLGSFSATANSLAIVSTSSGDGRTYVAANMAILFAQLGKRTVLVDAHLQNPRLHDLFGIQNVRGLSAALGPVAVREPTLHSVPQIGNLYVVVGGAPPANADDLLASDALGRVCRSLTSQFDIVLFDTPPGSSSGVDWIADRCGKVLLVVRQDRTRLARAKSFVERIRSRAEVVGCVMNKY